MASATTGTTAAASGSLNWPEIAISIIAVVISAAAFVVALKMLTTGKKSASAAKRSADAAHRSVEAATRKSLARLDDKISEPRRGKLLSTGETDITEVRFLNTGQQTVALEQPCRDCQCSPANAFFVRSWQVDVLLPQGSNYTTSRSRAPLPPGSMATAKLKIEFGETEGQTKCNGVVMFGTSPPLDESADCLKVPSEFSRAHSVGNDA